MSRPALSLLSIPIELVSRIVECHQDDPETLQRCSLTCTLLSSAAQAILFNRVTLDNEYARRDDKLVVSCSKSEQFSNLLQESPHLANYVRHLGICSAAFRCPALPNILTSLPYITSLYLFATHSGPLSHSEVSWDTVNPALLEAFRCHVFPTIRHLELEVFHMPLSLLALCSSLQQITNFFSPFLPAPVDTVPASSCRLLSRLSLSGGSPHTELPLLMDFIVLSNCDIMSLDIELHYGFQATDFLAIGRLLSICRPTLKSLQLTTINDPECVATKFNILNTFFSISNFPALTSLTVTIRIWQAFDGQHDVQFPELQWLIERIDALSKNSSLEKIVIEIWIECTKTPLFTFSGEELDRALMSLRLPLFKQLAICATQETPFFDDVAHIFRRGLPKSFSRGLLTFEDRKGES